MLELTDDEQFRCRDHIEGRHFGTADPGLSGRRLGLPYHAESAEILINFQEEGSL